MSIVIRRKADDRDRNMARAKDIGTGAPARAAQMWLQTNWAHIEAEVKRLQMRIAKATREGRWGKAKALQRLLTRSHSGKLLAVKRVTENRGKRTPGVDGKIWSPRRPNGKGCCQCNIAVIERCRYDVSTSRRAMARSVR